MPHTELTTKRQATIPTHNGIDILAEVPDGEGYRPTNNVCWFLGRFDFEKSLCQLWQSDYVGVPDVWVAVQTYTVDSQGS